MATRYGLFLVLLMTAGVIADRSYHEKEKAPTCEKRDDGSLRCTNAKLESLEVFRARSNDPDEPMTTDQGIPIADDQNSLKAGTRGPTLLEDFILREKITHFDHERTPERAVHARGSGAHGYFQPYGCFTDLTRAKFLRHESVVTPVFVRFSTVAGSKGSVDTARDIRGFATKFYTEEGNFDIVGNNIPVFFVQDAIKFPDFVHAVKPEPNNEIPQAASAHNTAWDFVAEQTETLHAITWVMSDRGIPRSYAMMEGFGVHTFRLVNASGSSVFVKFHWKPILGVHSLVWDEAQKLAGKNADFHRADLWNRIEAGNFPEFELGIQIVNEDAELDLGYDILDATKLVPEERSPIIKLGKMVLNRNPDNFFAETEQIAFDVANMVPGIDFTNDPLLQGRAFSYLDTQISRLGGPNFHEIPINRNICPFHTNNGHRDGIHREIINVGKTAYGINTLNKGLPAQAGPRGFSSYPESIKATKIRQRSLTFSDHFSQATTFWKSMADWEKDHIVAGFSFELAKVSVVDIRIKVVNHLQAIDYNLAKRVAANLDLELGPNPHDGYPKDVSAASSLSIAKNPGLNTIHGRSIAILAADGVDGKSVKAMKHALQDEGASVQIIAPRIGYLKSSTGGEESDLIADATLAGSPSVLFDAVYIPGGRKAIDILQENGDAVHYVLEAFKHYKPLAASGDGVDFLVRMGLIESQDKPKSSLPDGLIARSDNSLSHDFKNDFIANIARHRFYYREGTNSIPA